MKDITTVIDQCRHHAFDLDFKLAREWKGNDPAKVLVGYFPIYFPREIVHASGGLPVGILGAGDRKQIIKGDAYYQSYICHIPRGIIELALDGNLDHLDGFVFPSICDVMRNLSGMFRLLGKGKFVKYLDFPQNFQAAVGGEFYQSEMRHIIELMHSISGNKPTTRSLNNAIKLYNHNRQLLEAIYMIRQEFPWRLSYENLYHIIRAGMVMPVEQHNGILEQVLDYIMKNEGEPMDKIKVVIVGSFCEQPPVGLIKSIELAGCYIVDDDYLLGSRWIQGDVQEDTDDPLNALTEAYLQRSTFSSAVYDVGNPKCQRMIELVKKRKADGVLFAAPSFCDPALLDVPILQNICLAEGIRFINFQYSENTGQFKVIKEQVGAFSDSIKLWEDELVN